MTFKIGRVAYTRPYLLADTAELALLYGSFDQISEGDLLSIIKQSPKSAGELMPLSDPDIDGDGEDDRLDGAEQTDQQQKYIEECFRQIEFRISAFGDAYPFELKQNILYAKNDHSAYQTLYIFLLCCARTRSFSKRSMNRLADEFEKVCGRALAKMLPDNASVYLFGPNARRAGGIFSTNLIQAIPTLARLMGTDLGRNWQRNLNPQGDGKIDLIGIVPFDTFSHGYHVIIGQCAAMEDESNWQKKRLEALALSRRGLFAPLVDPQAALFFPACFRGPDGQWVDLDDVSGVIPIDRLRLVHVFSVSNDQPTFAEQHLKDALAGEQVV